MSAVRRHEAARLLLLRLAQAPLIVLIVSFAVFVLIQVVPGDPGRNALGPYASAGQVAAWNSAHGVTGGVMERYGAWLAGLLTGDWGVSLVYGAPVADLVWGRLANSLALGALAFVILTPTAIAIGAMQARAEGSSVDRSLTTVLMALAAVPEFVVRALLLVVFAVVVPLLPVQSSAGIGQGFGPQLRAMALPAVTLALGGLAVVARTVRQGAIDVLSSPYHRTAVLKGVPAGAVFRRHVARNALVPAVSLLGAVLGAMLCGSAVVETLFGYPGLGALLVTATHRADVALLTAGVMVCVAVSLVCLLAADLVLLLIDPRLRFSGRRSW